MGQNTLFDEYRSPVHVQCGRALIVALVPGVIGIASEHWLGAPSEGSGQIRHLGLWAVCSNFSRCASLPSPDFPDTFGVVRGMGLTAMCLHVLSVLVGLVCSCEDPDNLLGVNAYVPRLEENFAVVAGLLMAGALGIFAQSTRQHPVYHTFHLHWSFWVTVIYVCFLLIAGGVIVLIRYKCACRKKCLRSHKQTTARWIQTQKQSPVQTTSFDESPKDSTNFKVFVEYLKDMGPKYFDGSARSSSGGHKSFLDRIKGSAYVYRSLEGIPRVVKTSSRSPEETDVM